MAYTTIAGAQYFAWNGAEAKKKLGSLDAGWKLTGSVVGEYLLTNDTPLNREYKQPYAVPLSQLISDVVVPPTTTGPTTPEGAMLVIMPDGRTLHNRDVIEWVE